MPEGQRRLGITIWGKVGGGSAQRAKHRALCHQLQAARRGHARGAEVVDGDRSGLKPRHEVTRSARRAIYHRAKLAGDIHLRVCANFQIVARKLPNGYMV
jgi:hypothetical protein